MTPRHRADKSGGISATFLSWLTHYTYMTDIVCRHRSRGRTRPGRTTELDSQTCLMLLTSMQSTIMVFTGPRELMASIDSETFVSIL